MSVLSSNNLKFLSDSDCFVFEQYSDNNMCQIKINSSQYWSTCDLSFMIKNKCKTPQLIKNLVIKVDGWKLDGSLVSNFSVGQSGPNWVNIQNYVKDQTSFVIINSQPCEGEWCDWAKAPSNGIYILTLQTSINGPIKNSTVPSLSFGQIEPVVPGTVIIKVDGSLIDKYDFNINISLWNSTSSLKTITYNPIKEKNSFKFDNLEPGYYSVNIDPNTLNISDNQTIKYTISQGTFNLTSGYEQIVEIKFEVIILKKGQLKIDIGNIPNYYEGNIELIITNTINLKTEIINLNKEINYAKIKVIEGDEYNIRALGLGFPSKGVYYEPINENVKVYFTGDLNIQILKIEYAQLEMNELSKKTFKLSGFDLYPVVLNFKSDDYVYSKLSLNDQITENIFFIKNTEVEIIYTDLPGFLAIFSSKIINDKINLISIENKLAPKTKNHIGGYYQSWSANWTSDPSKLSLSNIPGYVKYILISFADPNTNYKKGTLTWNGTGLNFSSDFSVVRDSIRLAKKRNPDQIFLLSVGGATYHFTNTNFKGLVDLMNDLELDGIDIDYENTPSCINLNNDNLSCNTDNDIISIIDNFANIITNGKLLTAAVFSVGAYGNSMFPNFIYGPQSSYAGMWVNPLIKKGNKLNAIFIMSYDASDQYSPKDALKAYRSIFSNDILVGLEVPPEAWGGHVLKIDEAIDIATYTINNGGAGVFIWSLQKKDQNVDANTYIKPICKVYGYECSNSIPLN